MNRVLKLYCDVLSNKRTTFILSEADFQTWLDRHIAQFPFKDRAAIDAATQHTTHMATHTMGEARDYYDRNWSIPTARTERRRQ